MRRHDDLGDTQEGPPSEDDSYLGYSIASGEFNGDNEPDIVVGMPRGSNLTGKVGTKSITSSKFFGVHKGVILLLKSKTTSVH